VRDAFANSYGSDVNMIDVFGEDSDYDVGRSLAAEFIQKTGLEVLPQVGIACSVSFPGPSGYKIFVKLKKIA
jgi:hypothetical protein